jgi:hypothetical protein
MVEELREATAWAADSGSADVMSATRRADNEAGCNPPPPGCSARLATVAAS